MASEKGHRLGKLGKFLLPPKPGVHGKVLCFDWYLKKLDSYLYYKTKTKCQKKKKERKKKQTEKKKTLCKNYPLLRKRKNDPPNVAIEKVASFSM